MNEDDEYDYEYKDDTGKFWIIIALAVAVVLFLGWNYAYGDESVKLTGAGSSFAAPLYGAWAQGFKDAEKGTVNYQSIGSGGGIKAIETGTVDFGATDKPLGKEELDKFNLIQFPTAVGGVVVVVNIPGVEKFSLSRQMIADVFSGKITNWKELTDGKTGGKYDIPIAVVHRSDGSGTTFLFTNYLSKVSKEWKENIGEGSTVEWPVGIGAKGNEGVAVNVQNTIGSIGYVEYAYAKKNNLTMICMENKVHKDVCPSLESFKEAVKSVKWDENYGNILTDQDGEQSWPITGATFMLVNKTKPDVVHKLIKFVGFGFDQMHYALDLDYVPIDTKTQVNITFMLFDVR